MWLENCPVTNRKMITSPGLSVPDEAINVEDLTKQRTLAELLRWVKWKIGQFVATGEGVKALILQQGGYTFPKSHVNKKGTKKTRWGVSNRPQVHDVTEIASDELKGVFNAAKRKEAKSILTIHH